MPETRRRIRWIDIQESITGYLFILPAAIIITVFGLFPIGYAVYMSSYKWLVRQGSFVGLGNYEKAIGDWYGAVLFGAGFALLVGVYMLWQRVFTSEGARNDKDRPIIGVLALVVGLSPVAGALLNGAAAALLAWGTPDNTTPLVQAFTTAFGENLSLYFDETSNTIRLVLLLVFLILAGAFVFWKQLFGSSVDGEVAGKQLNGLILAAGGFGLLYVAWNATLGAQETASWQRGIAFYAIGAGLLFFAFRAWMSAIQDGTNARIVLRVALALALIAAAFAIIAFGWGRMIETGDDDFLLGLPITFYYAMGTVPAEIGLALVLAYILFQKIRGQELFRMIFFLPYITPVVASAVVFRFIFSPRETSLANQFLAFFRLEPLEWLQEAKPLIEILFGMEVEGFFAGPSLALVSIILFGIWTYVGYNTVIFLAGLGSIPRELYEAAEIDGANEVQSFRFITLPLLSPVTFYLMLIAFIGTFKAFNHIYVMRTPSALGTADTASVVIFDTFYKANQYGFAASQAILLFFIILGLTMIQNKVFGERVFYG